MKLIEADFNAMIDAERMSLNMQCAEDDRKRLGIHPGDWAWLTDGELVVGARVEEDPYWGVVGSVHWNTLVPLDDEEAQDFPRIWEELQEVLHRPAGDVDDPRRAFELLTIFEATAPPEKKAATMPGDLAFRRAKALDALGEPELALIEVEDALEARLDDPDIIHDYLEILRRIDPERACREAELRAEAADAGAS